MIRQLASRRTVRSAILPGSTPFVVLLAKSSIRCALAMGTFGLFALDPLFAQAVRTVPLGTASARVLSPFSLLTTVRELRSGEVMVADPIERKVFLLPASLQSMRTLGREGSGPGEYKQPDAVWPWPGDSTLVVDLGNGRLSIVGPTGIWSRSIPMAGTNSDGPPSVMFPGGTDAQGRIYFAPPGGGQSDSANVMRADPRAGGAAQPVARIKTPDVDRQESGSANERSIRLRPIPLAASDGWAVSPAGEVVVARSGGYRVEWLASGAVRSGKPVSFTRVPIREAEKREWVNQQMLSGGISMNVNIDNGQRTMSLGRSRPEKEPSIDGYKWPSDKPPFEAGSLRVDAGGRLWVRRHVAANQPRVFDVFGRDGNHLASVTFPAGRSLVGFGVASLYAVNVDDDGQYFLERYRMPI